MRIDINKHLKIWLGHRTIKSPRLKTPLISKIWRYLANVFIFKCVYAMQSHEGLESGLD